MKCEEFDSRFHALLDQGVRPDMDDSLEQHAEDCPWCAADSGAWESIMIALETQDIPELDDRFSHQVVASVLQAAPKCPSHERTTTRGDSHEQAPPSGFAMWQSGFGMVAAMAAILVLSLVPMTELLRPSREGSPALVEESRPSPQPSQILPVQEPPETVLSDLSPWLPNISTAGIEVDRIAEPFRPVATSFTVAIEALRKTIPVGRLPGTGQKPSSGAAISRQKHLVG